jgi:hypothetical protein
MMADENEGVMFEIGVMEHPATAGRLEKLAASVLDYQKKMTFGVESIGSAALSVKDSIDSVSSSISKYEASTSASIGNVEQAIKQLRALTMERIVQTVEVVIKEAESQSGSPEAVEALQRAAARAREAVSGLRVESEGAIAPVVDVVSLQKSMAVADGLRQRIDSLSASHSPGSPIADEMIAQFRVAQDQIEELQSRIDKLRSSSAAVPTNIANAMASLGDGGAEADAIADAVERALTSVDAARDATAELRTEWGKRISDQEKAYSSLRESHSKAVSDHRSAVDSLNSSISQGAKGFVNAAKGAAQMGLVSEESSKRMLQGLVTIEAATNILDGIVDVVDLASKGWSQLRTAVDAATQAKRIEMTLAGPQFALMKSYQAQLHAEASAAAEATAANLALGRSRSAGMAGGKGAANTAGQALASGAVNVGGKVGSGAAGAVVAGGGAAGAGSLGVASAGMVATVAAFGAAVAAVSLVLYELAEIATGHADKEKSLTMTIAKSEVSMAASVFRMTGAFEKADGTAVKMAQSFSSSLDSIWDQIPIIGEFGKRLNLVGDIATLAASQAGVERGQKRLAKSRLESERDEGLGKANLNASLQIERSNFDRMASAIRGDLEPKSISNSIAVDRTIGSEADRVRNLRRAQEMNDADVASFARSNPIHSPESDFETFASRTRIGASVNDVSAKLNAEKQIHSEALRLLGEHEAAAAKAAEDLGKSSEAYQTQRKEILRIEDEIEKSLDVQKRLTTEKTALEVQSQRKLMEGLEAKMRSYSTEISRLKGDYQNSALSFAKMDDVDQQFAKDALVQAQTKGAASLDDRQRGLLRTVGSEEAMRFANEADLAEAKSKGFDQTFGAGIQQRVGSLDMQRQQIEAQVKSTYDVAVEVQLDSEKIVRSIVSETQAAMNRKADEIQESVKQQLSAETTKIKQAYQGEFRKLNRARS